MTATDPVNPRGLSVEQYAEFVAPATRLWSIIAVPGRLPEWTGARRVEVLGPGPDALPDAAASPAADVTWSPGLRVVIHERDTTTWRVISLGQRVVEASAATPCGQLGIGVRVIELRTTDPARPAAAADAAAGAEPAGNRPPGSRVVFVARLEPAGSTVRARVRDVPAIRRRFDRWTAGLRDATERSDQPRG